MKHMSILAAAMIALAAPASASTVSSVSTNASLDPSGNVWRLGAEVSRDNRLRTRSRSIFRERNSNGNGGVRAQNPLAPIYGVGNLQGLNRLFNSGSNGNTSFFTGPGRAAAVAVGPSKAGGNGFDILDLIPSNGGSSLIPVQSVTSVSVVPVPATLPLLLGGFGLLAFMRRRA